MWRKPRPQLPYACIAVAGMRPSLDHDASDSGPHEEHGRLGQSEPTNVGLWDDPTLVQCNETLVAPHESAFDVVDGARSRHRSAIE